MRKHTYRISFLDYNFLPHWVSVTMSVIGSGVWERIVTCEKTSHETWIQEFRFLMLMNNTGYIFWILSLFEDLFLSELASVSDFFPFSFFIDMENNYNFLLPQNDHIQNIKIFILRFAEKSKTKSQCTVWPPL